MTVYFQGTELQDFSVVSSSPPVHNTASTTFRKTANTRCAIECAAAISGNDDSRFMQSDTIGVGEFWVHFVAHLSVTWTAGSGMFNWLRLRNSAGTNLLTLQFDASNLPNLVSARFFLRKFDGSFTTIGTTGSLGNLTTALHDFDIYIKLGNPGSVRIYLDGVPVISDDNLDLTWIGGDTVVDHLRLGTAIGGNGNMYYSEVIIADWNTINSKLVSRVPDANGTYTAWAGGGFTELNEVTPASTYMTSDTADQRISVLFTDFPALDTSERIENVKVTAVALRDASGPQSMNIFARVDSVDYDKSDVGLTIVPGNYSEVWDLSPDTATFWTPTELNASEFGVRSRT